MGEDIRLSLPSIMLDREQFITAWQLLQAVIAMIAFSVMASAKKSHHTEYHYSFYPSLTFFVVVGVCSFVYSLLLAAAKQLGIVVEELRSALELYGSGVMIWLTYTAAIAASATSTDLHSIFNEKEGSTCRSRDWKSIAVKTAGTYFCSRLVASIVFMYLLCATYIVTILAIYLPGGARYVSGGFYTSSYAP